MSAADSRPEASTVDRRLRALFEQAGARWVELPVLHPADPFLETAGEDIRRRMFVTEGARGERLALRSDFTIPVCLYHLDKGGGPARYAYQGVVFRRHDTGSPERLEAGYEDIGRADGAEADAEAVALALAGAAAIAPGPLSLRFGDMGFFAALLRALGLPGRWRRRLRRSFGAPQRMEKNLARLAAPRDDHDLRLDPEIRAAAESGNENRVTALLAERALQHGLAEGWSRSPAEIARRFLDGRALPAPALAERAVPALQAFLRLEAELAGAEAALAGFAAEHGLNLDEALAAFAARAEAIRKHAPAASVRFNGGFGRPLDYYTGLVFEVRAEAAAAPIAGGGRYDGLMEMLGAPERVPAVGFTMRLEPGVGESR